MQILVGADPELFVLNPNSNEFVSAHGMVQGTKYDPFPVQCGAIQVDGMALEFNIDPAATAEEFTRNIATVQEALRAAVPSGYSIVAEPAAVFTDAVMEAAPEEAKELGCEPDYSAYSGVANPRPNSNTTLRTASGHVHIGWTQGKDVRSNNHNADCHAVVKQMDYALGIHSLLWDPDNRRRSMYGMAGAYRPKPYGVEYRVMSNRWLSDVRLQSWVFNTVQQAMADLAAGRKYFEQHGELARKIIDENITDWPSRYQLGLGIPTPPGLKGLKVA